MGHRRDQYRWRRVGAAYATHLLPPRDNTIAEDTHLRRLARGGRKKKKATTKNSNLPKGPEWVPLCRANQYKLVAAALPRLPLAPIHCDAAQSPPHMGPHKGCLYPSRPWARSLCSGVCDLSHSFYRASAYTRTHARTDKRSRYTPEGGAGGVRGAL